MDMPEGSLDVGIKDDPKMLISRLQGVPSELYLSTAGQHAGADPNGQKEWQMIGAFSGLATPKS
jgi:hypothetical protein